MDWIEANGAGLRYALSGKGRQTLVLVHEMGGTLESWDMLVPQLDPRFRVLRYDTRGAGISTKARSPLSIDTMAQDLESLLDALGVDGPVLLAGCAVGGAIALHFAATRPSRVLGLIAMGPATGIPEERRQAILDYADTVQRDGMAAVAETELARSYPEILRSDAARFRSFRARWLANDPDSYAAIYRMLAGLEMQAGIASIRCPALFMAGQHDPLRPPAMIEPLSRLVPGASFQAVESGHFMAVQTPEIVAEAFNLFLARF
ncbi:alpha/beta fold hydrolase [Pseudoroseomonas wenyumeiae]|uniref:Alpha/beta fold hydrolase n=1 Tax=Teichococcus wenyumeiae TaxID=2478470 RepID=A0A3A9JD37_9PROT|nr:alpha/beta hydrolase [Pseudoroseomonas wenyumeiae]RKK05237.1 alpha/beta fold hydrolase [Pseudoroseomonas wenyumeiae]RMI19893.1 alpha/beta fold hydrolase [Pseudoroseomonas wenyumeiae]